MAISSLGCPRESSYNRFSDPISSLYTRLTNTRKLAMSGSWGIEPEIASSESEPSWSLDECDTHEDSVDRQRSCSPEPATHDVKSEYVHELLARRELGPATPQCVNGKLGGHRNFLPSGTAETQAEYHDRGYIGKWSIDGAVFASAWQGSRCICLHDHQKGFAVTKTIHARQVRRAGRLLACLPASLLVAALLTNCPPARLDSFDGPLRI